MDSIRGCTKSCFILFDQWLDKLLVGSDEQVIRQRISNSVEANGSGDPLDGVPLTLHSIRDAEDRVAVENLVFRFRIWAEHNSALSKRHNSLDWRLRKSSMAHSVMVDLLTDLSHAILSTLPRSPQDPSQ